MTPASTPTRPVRPCGRRAFIATTRLLSWVFASVVLILVAHALVVVCCVGAIDRRTHFLTGACYLFFIVLTLAGLMPVDYMDRDLDGRWDGRWATGTFILFPLTLALAFTTPDQMWFESWIESCIKNVLCRLLRLW